MPAFLPVVAGGPGSASLSSGGPLPVLIQGPAREGPAGSPVWTFRDQTSDVVMRWDFTFFLHMYKVSFFLIL